MSLPAAFTADPEVQTLKEKRRSVKLYIYIQVFFQVLCKIKKLDVLFLEKTDIIGKMLLRNQSLEICYNPYMSKSSGISDIKAVHVH